MASVSITHLILFIASILVAASVAGVLTDEVGRLSEAINDQGLDASESVRTDVEIISDGGSGNVYDGSNNVTLYVKNTGSQRLEASADELDVLVDGEYQTLLNVTVLDAETWGANDVARVNVTVPGGLAPGDHRVKVIVNGDEEVFQFRS